MIFVICLVLTSEHPSYNGMTDQGYHAVIMPKCEGLIIIMIERRNVINKGENYAI